MKYGSAERPWEYEDLSRNNYFRCPSHGRSSLMLRLFIMTLNIVRFPSNSIEPLGACMTTLAVVLKDEIRRLARKEIKAQTGKHARAVAQYRREIARLKREQRAQDKQIGFLSAQLSKKQSASAPVATRGDERRFSARSVKAQRRRTGLSAGDYAKLIGVSPLTVYNREN